MTKEELVLITLRQLNNSFKTTPECLDLEDYTVTAVHSSFSGPTIIWRRMIEVNGENIQDPNNAARTVIITYNKLAKELSCYIFFREVTNIQYAIAIDAKIELKWRIPFLHTPYWKFMALRKKLIHRIKNKQSIEYLDKLSEIFPTTFTDDLLK